MTFEDKAFGNVYLEIERQRKIREEEEHQRKLREEEEIKYREEEERQRKLREEEERKRRKEEAQKMLSSLGDYKDIGGGYITFGVYPQSKKANGVGIGDVIDSELGYYIGNDNNVYAKLNSNYFKVEPIKWKVLQRGSEIFVVADDILDAHRFDGSSNNYANSEIRAFINGEFYNRAFNDNQKTKISTTFSSTMDSLNKTCSYTSDKVFLLSYEEVKQYLYSCYESRKCAPTGYAEARGVDTKWVKERIAQITSEFDFVKFDEESFKKNGRYPCMWWLRSGYYYNSYYYVYFIDPDGKFEPENCLYYDHMGIVPALKINVGSVEKKQYTSNYSNNADKKESQGKPNEEGGSWQNSDDFVIADNILFRYRGKGGDVVIPDGVTEIGKEAFYKNKIINSIIIPNSVRTIGESAFSNCKSLIIYCRTKKPLLGLPKGWDKDWLGKGKNKCKAKIIWDYKG